LEWRDAAPQNGCKIDEFMMDESRRDELTT